jgi:protein TonB
VSSRTIAISAAVHLGLAASLLLVAGSRHAREAISVAVFSEKKEAPPKPKPLPPRPKPPPPPRPRVTPEEPPSPSAAPQAVAPAPAAPVELESVELSSEDLAGAVVIPVKRRAQAAPPKLASLTQRPPPGQRPRDDAPCEEPPTKPKPTYRVEIEYLAQARAEGVEGRLVLRIHVAPNGAVTRVEVLSPVQPALDAAAVATVMQWRFRPAMACGRPAPGVFTIARKFELGD